jgi:hypothetical protein
MQAESVPEIFTDITRQAGVTWRQFDGESSDRLLIETMGGGVALLDFDGDGLLDIFLVNGGETPRGKSTVPVRNALYRNLGNGRFEDVAMRAGVDRISSYGMGVAVGDYDNDGYPDLYVTGYPASMLFHNNRNGTFTDVSKQAGVVNADKWAAGAAWFDYDRDGLLDLVVTNYVFLSLENPKKCEVNGTRSYCEQVAYQGMPLTLFHNNGNGTFADASQASGLYKFIGRALGVVSADINDDGWPDLFISRDASPNLLLINQHNGTFRDTAVDAEVAYDSNGVAKAGMGIDLADVNRDGLPDFVMTTFNDQYHSLLLGSPSGIYQDKTVASGLAKFTKPYVGWGVKFFDYDNDGYMDLMIVNGHINQVIESTRNDVKYRERPLLLHNNGQGVFQDMQAEAGAAFKATYSGRGLAIGDFDNDGDSDIIFTSLNSQPVLLRNNLGQRNHWMGLELEGTKSSRDAIGAKITITVGKQKLVRWITGGSSYLSSHDKRALVGLGQARPDAVTVEVRWSSGSVQQLSGLQIDKYHQVREEAK